MPDITYTDIGTDCPVCGHTLAIEKTDDGIYYDCENCYWSQYDFTESDNEL